MDGIHRLFDDNRLCFHFSWEPGEQLQLIALHTLNQQTFKYTVHYTVYTVQYTMYTVHYTVYTVHIVLQSVYCTYPTQCILLSIINQKNSNTLYTTQWTRILYNHYTVYTVQQCTLYMYYTVYLYIPYTVYIALHTLNQQTFKYIVLCTEYTVHYTVYTVHTLHIVIAYLH